MNKGKLPKRRLRKNHPSGNQNTHPDNNTGPRFYVRPEFWIAVVAAAVSIWSLHTANKAYDFSKKEFFNTYKPFLQFEIFNNDSVRTAPGHPFVFSFRIKNLGKYPVKFLRRKIGMRFLEADPIFDEFKNEEMESSIELVGDVSIATGFTSRIIDQSLYDSLMTDQRHIYFFLNFEYENLINHKLNRFEYLILWLNYGQGVKILHNENYEIN